LESQFLKNIPRTAASQFFYGPWPKGKVNQDQDPGILFRFRNSAKCEFIRAGRNLET